MAVPWEAPSPLTGDITVLKHINYTQKTSGEGLCEGRSAEYWKVDEPRSPTVDGHLYGLEVRHVPWRRLCPHPPNEGCNPSFFCNEPRLKISKSPVQVQRGLRGVTVPHCTSTCLPLAHTWSWENTQISHYEGRRIPFYNFLKNKVTLKFGKKRQTFLFSSLTSWECSWSWPWCSLGLVSIFQFHSWLNLTSFELNHPAWKRKLKNGFLSCLCHECAVAPLGNFYGVIFYVGKGNVVLNAMENNNNDNKICYRVVFSIKNLGRRGLVQIRE